MDWQEVNEIRVNRANINELNSNIENNVEEIVRLSLMVDDINKKLDFILRHLNIKEGFYIEEKNKK